MADQQPAPSRSSCSTQIVLENLSAEHYTAVQLSMSKMLSTPLAGETFAQIVDGLPTRDVYLDYYNSYRPDFEENLVPSQSAMDAVESYRKKFDIGCLQVDTNVAQAYQNASRGSKEFNLRLMEILAILCHEVAVSLYNTYDGGLRKPDSAEVYRQMPKPILTLKIPLPPDWQQYPHEKADIVIYWAEYRLFGGVVLFDRGETGLAVENYMSFLFLDQPQDSFTLSETSKCMRFKAEKSAPRIDPWDAMAYLHIYRDRYERKVPDQKPWRCVVRVEDEDEYRQAFLDMNERTKRMRAQKEE
ncbi:hypothetical protein AJ79_09450 [Helicocarpus griseus UAMH5409]|uniref:Uncharacterized protein n=1 Tax=Helicocarpus griseus UAMH5409 TaxID=1447875 RepID=A0A2B7WJS9_9EURO|nr:hypothetical protein AJ79_09450 [Helicocarpus griseus UAMH5409]